MCEFCNDYKDQRAFREKYCSDRYKETMYTKYNLTLVSTDYRKEDGVRIGILETGTYPINYCPVCGKKLKESQNEHKRKTR